MCRRHEHDSARRSADCADRDRPAARPVTQVEIAKPPDTPAPLPESVECSPEALLQFCTKVQPVLMNACVSCHAATGKFRLQRVYSNTPGGRAASFQNLSAALAQ